MGLGGYLTWTAAAEEIKKAVGSHIKFLPIEQHGNFIKIVHSEVFEHNKNFLQVFDKQTNDYIFPLILNNPAANYCKQDTPEKAFQRGDKHIIEQCCEVYGIGNPTLKCYLNFSEEENKKINSIVQQHIGNEDYLTIEPYSKDNYTPNRAYDFKKWQQVVNELHSKIKIVQVGNPNQPILENVINLTGKTTFFEAAGVIGRSKLFMSSEGGLVHAATAVNTTSLVILTGYQTEKMVAYPQNINIRIATHGPCGLKRECKDCKKDVEDHDWHEIVDKIHQRFLWKM